MSYRCGFFNSKTGAVRTYNADDLSFFYSKFFNNGVIYEDSSNLQVVFDSGMNILVKPGTAFIDGKWINVESDDLHLVQNGDSTYARKDIVVVQLNNNDATMKILVKKGEASVSPVAPELIRTDYIYELQLAEITVPANAITLSQSQIKDTRLDSTLCGKVTLKIQ